MRAALAGGEEVNKRSVGGADQEGATGLMWAAWEGHEAVVELLLQQPGLDTNLSGGPNNLTALHLACIKGHVAILRRLLAHPSLTCHNNVDIFGNTPLMLAERENKFECAMELEEAVDLDLEEVGLEEMATTREGLEAWQGVREEQGRREVQRRKDTEGKRTSSVLETMVKYRFLEKQSKQKQKLLKKAKAKEAKEKRLRAVEAQRTNVESVQETIGKEVETVRNEKNTIQVSETSSSKRTTAWQSLYLSFISTERKSTGSQAVVN